MSTKFFNNIDATLLDKFHGIASAMANFDIFYAVELVQQRRVDIVEKLGAHKARRVRRFAFQ